MLFRSYTRGRLEGVRIIVAVISRLVGGQAPNLRRNFASDRLERSPPNLLLFPSLRSLQEHPISFLITLNLETFVRRVTRFNLAKAEATPEHERARLYSLRTSLDRSGTQEIHY